jgi:predicted RNA-binding protein
MKYWLIAIPRAAMDHLLELKVFGRTSHQRLQEVSVGDKLAFYVTVESNIIALGEVTRPYYKSNTDIFKDERSLFAHRIDFKANSLSKPIAFRTKIERLDFIKNKAAWPAYIRRGFAEMSEKDWNTLTSSN